MSARTFEGSVSIVKNTKGEIALKRDPEGSFTAKDAAVIYEKLIELAKKHKATINTYSMLLTENGTEPVLLANRYGNPYIALLPKRSEGGKSGPKVVKLA
jgi:hypothetical protein